MKATYVHFICTECRRDVPYMPMEDAFERMRANDMLPAPEYWADSTDLLLMTLCYGCLPRCQAVIQTQTSCICQHPGWADLHEKWVRENGVSLTSLEHFRPEVRVVDTGHACALRSVDEAEWRSCSR